MQVLKDCIAQAGSVEGGLRYYVGAANMPDDGGYAAKVLGEQSHLKQVAAGKAVAVTVPQTVARPAEAPAKAAVWRPAPQAKAGPGARSAWLLPRRAAALNSRTLRDWR